ncbi:Diphthamide biosynthesis protein 3 [Orbilia oligospora]|uniref:Diphthamide biosynthesis protein 3 n=1 Tax=Orbilia oligospora TaxID=2813651 RepID=A0A7C8QUM5_ORBOL|nr:Diphthamide biosynthesis protein 3 [Orbilia oligospora]
MEESIYDEIEIEDMTYDPTLQIFHYPCPCGDRFEIAIGDLREGEDIAVCPGCSLMIRVIFEVVGALSSLSPRRIWIRTLELEEWEEWLLLRLEEEEKEFEIWRCRLFEEGVWESMLEVRYYRHQRYQTARPSRNILLEDTVGVYDPDTGNQARRFWADSTLRD